MKIIFTFIQILKKWFKKISKYKYNAIILGHTHIPMNKKLPNKMKILNPGSVGQPRDKTCGASWMVLNSDKMIFQIVKTKYDHTKIKKQIKKYDKNNIRFFRYFIKCN